MLRSASGVVGLAVAVALRVAVSWGSEWGETLVARSELATAMDRIELLREASFLLNTLQVDPKAVWASLSVHHSPLLLVLDRLISDPVRSACTWIAMDVTTGLVLAAVASRLAQNAGGRVKYLSPAAVAACYWMNPYAIACCAAKSMATLRVLLVALSVLFAVLGASLRLALVHTLSTLLFLNPLMLTPALVLLGADSYAEHGRWRATFGMRRADAWSEWMRRTLLRMAVFAATGLVGSAILSRDGSWTFVRSVYGSRLLFDDLAPSAGLAWYFFVQMFEHFHSFFVLVVNLHMWAYMVPVTIKYRSDPLFAVTILYGIQCLFQNYTSVGDTALFMALWSLSSTRLSDYLRYPMVTSLLFAYTTLLMPAFHYLWLYAGSANANFYYAINLVHAVGIGSLILDAGWAWGHERWEKERTPVAGKEGQRRTVVQR
ncbi:uncharacterized protein MJAP1_001066 [Malassezia japonica]|uniref:GPI transamidase subunit PIG-U n=1 Tax=Malassezia japonica TaxID=223818 RepID=A0AAF0EVZ1_9BASI|nr:uncharacterized protein MJAP1_001066 [Malassezia japonica]WFD38118.1 hypothetical protein MJAP1_001066 [Malassezia japonica]